ncbi:brkDBD domain-containing protein [Trichonephila clavipes]|nr:brkDBD domain-containing protein [Trichonephila clavipes]
MREYASEFFTLLNANGKKELIEWGMKEGLIASSYECPKCNDRHDVTWSAIKRFLRNRITHAESELIRGKGHDRVRSRLFTLRTFDDMSILEKLAMIPKMDVDPSENAIDVLTPSDDRVELS